MEPMVIVMRPRQAKKKRFVDLARERVGSKLNCFQTALVGDRMKMVAITQVVGMPEGFSIDVARRVDDDELRSDHKGVRDNVQPHRRARQAIARKDWSRSQEVALVKLIQKEGGVNLRDMRIHEGKLRVG